jgi:LmbE family N-acetylglucosaminyl deacetylase
MRAEGPLDRLCGAREALALGSVLLVAAHPDDETIGAGGRLARLGAAFTIVHVTDGAPVDRRFFPSSAARLSRPAYARTRRDEALRALALARIPASRVISFGVRDQESAFEMEAIADRLAGLWDELRPALVVTHAYEGGHPDHDATAFAVHAAAALPLTHIPAPIIEMTSYHDQGDATVRGEFLPSVGARERTVVLEEEERKQKRAMLSAFVTQREVLGAFHSENERFRLAPRYRFERPPHDGRLHYERFGFELSGAIWRALAGSARKKLGLPEGPL